MESGPETIIIGAGMTGISCARVLEAAGQRVRLLDKGRGIGGRMATRRVRLGAGEISFDHGAQYLRPRDPAFRQCLEAAGAAEWEGAHEGLVGVPGMSALPRALAAGLEISQATEVSALAHDAEGWHIVTATGALRAARLVLTVPAPQALHLLGPRDPVAFALAKVKMRPCLTLMAAFAPGSPAPFDARQDAAHPLAWVARNSSKPERGAAAASWVAQAGPEFSQAHLEDDTQAVAARMLPLLCDLIGTAPAQALHVAAHRWRYGLVTRPLARPFVQDAARGLYLGGDWCLGARAEDGWQSGQAIARAILEAA